MTSPLSEAERRVRSVLKAIDALTHNVWHAQSRLMESLDGGCAHGVAFWRRSAEEDLDRIGLLRARYDEAFDRLSALRAAEAADAPVLHAADERGCA